MGKTIPTDLRELSGTSRFADALAERERALGLVLAPTPPESEPEPEPEPPTLFDSIAEPVPAPEELDEPDEADSAAALNQSPLDAQAACDPWGNVILGAPGHLGQYRIRSTRDGRELHICGEAASKAHLWAWEYDEGERRYICAVCWPEVLSAPGSE